MKIQVLFGIECSVSQDSSRHIGGLPQTRSVATRVYQSYCIFHPHCKCSKLQNFTFAFLY